MVSPAPSRHEHQLTSAPSSEVQVSAPQGPFSNSFNLIIPISSLYFQRPRGRSCFLQSLPLNTLKQGFSTSALLTFQAGYFFDIEACSMYFETCSITNNSPLQVPHNPVDMAGRMRTTEQNNPGQRNSILDFSFLTLSLST